MSFTETLQGLTGKPLADCTNQELYLALLELVRQKSADRVQPVTGRKLYYISAEFLRWMPYWLPSPSSASKRGVSVGVEMIRMS